jgi:hypothetical protein
MTGVERGMLSRRVRVNNRIQVISSAAATALTTFHASLTLKNLETPSWRRKAEKAMRENASEIRQYTDPSMETI